MKLDRAYSQRNKNEPSTSAKTINQRLKKLWMRDLKGIETWARTSIGDDV